MKKISAKARVAIATLLGFSVAESIALWNFYTYFHGSVPAASPLVRTILISVWPTVLLVPLDAGYDRTGFIALSATAVANGLLYGTVTLGINALLKSFVSRTKGGHQGSGWWPSSRSE